MSHRTIGRSVCVIGERTVNGASPSERGSRYLRDSGGIVRSNWQLKSYLGLRHRYGRRSEETGKTVYPLSFSFFWLFRVVFFFFLCGSLLCPLFIFLVVVLGRVAAEYRI